MQRIPRVTVYRRTRRGRDYWTVRWREDGTQREHGSHTTRDEAEDAAHQIRQQLRQRLPGIRPPSETLAATAAWWWDTYALQRLAKSTIYLYRGCMRRIIRDLGSIHTDRLDRRTIRNWHDQLLADESVRIANATLTCLSSILQRAVEDDRIPTNVARGVRRHPETREPITVPTDEDVIRLAITAPSMEARCMLMIAVYAGVRQGELFALHGADLQPGRLVVRRAVGADQSLKTTKTGKHRMVPLPGPISDSLHDSLGSVPDDKLLFQAPRGGVKNRSRWAMQEWKPWREAAEVDVQWQHFRHYFASSISSAGATIAQCCAWMGHASIQTTISRYVHLFDADEQRVMKRLTER